MIVETIETTFLWIADVADFVAALMIVIGFARGLVGWVMAEFTSQARRWDGIRNARSALGRYLLLGLEFMIVSDLLHSCVERSLDGLLELGLLVVIRTVISFFLGKELEAADAAG